MYYSCMTKKILKKILLNYFKESTVDHLLRGTRLISMTKAKLIKKEHGISLDVLGEMSELPKDLIKEAQKEE